MILNKNPLDESESWSCSSFSLVGLLLGKEKISLLLGKESKLLPVQVCERRPVVTFESSSFWAPHSI